MLVFPMKKFVSMHLIRPKFYSRYGAVSLQDLQHGKEKETVKQVDAATTLAQRYFETTSRKFFDS